VVFSPDKDISYFLWSHAHEDLYLIVITVIRENGVCLKLVVFDYKVYLLKGQVVTFNNKDIFIIFLK
jgi:hypothetical protein